MIRISIVFILLGLVANMACGQSVVVTPEETDEILANPGMGWQTFHRTLVHQQQVGTCARGRRRPSRGGALSAAARLAYRLSGGQGDERIFIGSVTVNKWLPGSIDLFTEEFFKQPDDSRRTSNQWFSLESRASPRMGGIP
jgi:hypothetical protein